MSLNNIRTIQGSRAIVQNHGLSVSVSNSLFFGTLFEIPRHRLSAVVLCHYSMDSNRVKHAQAEVLRNALLHKSGLIQGFVAYGARLYLLDDFDYAIRFVLVLEEVVFPLLGGVPPVLFGQPFLNKAGPYNLLGSILVHQLAEKDERELFRHITKGVLVEVFIVEFLKWCTVKQAML